MKHEKKYIIFKNEKGVLEKRRILTIYHIDDPKKDYVIFYDDTEETIKNLVWHHLMQIQNLKILI